MAVQQMEQARTSALEKAILVLRTLAASERPLGLAELSEEIDLPRQTIHRVLQQLADAGLIIRAHQRDRYQVGPEMMRLSQIALVSRNVHPPVRALLRQLVDQTDETCNVGILDQDEIVYIERVESNSPLRLDLEIGSRVPIHCTAIGKLLVAEQHKNVRTRILGAAPLQRFTDNTITDPAALEDEFARIRSQGYSFNNEEYVFGLTAIAVAIRDSEKKAVAAVAIHAPSTRMDLEKAIAYADGAKAVADRIAEIWAIA